MTRTQRKPLIIFSADDVWAASCAAFRLNGQYIKVSDRSTGTESNREIMDLFLGNPVEFVKDEDREMGKKVRAYYQALSFKILKGVKLLDFENNAMLIANRDSISTNFDLAVIASLPASYDRVVKRQYAESRVNFATGDYVGPVGAKLTLEVEVLRCNYSQNYGVYFVSAITDADSPVFFPYKFQFETGKKLSIGGTVKAHRDNQTHLNRVKVFNTV